MSQDKSQKLLSPQDQNSLTKIVPVLQDWMERSALNELALSVSKLVYIQARYKPNIRVRDGLAKALDTHFCTNSEAPAQTGDYPMEIS